MKLQGFEEKVDNAVHAAMNALGLSVAGNNYTSEMLNDAISEIVADLVSDDRTTRQRLEALLDSDERRMPTDIGDLLRGIIDDMPADE